MDRHSIFHMNAKTIMTLFTAGSLIAGTYFYLENVQRRMDELQTAVSSSIQSLENRLESVADEERDRDSRWLQSEEADIAEQNAFLRTIVERQNEITSELAAQTVTLNTIEGQFTLGSAQWRADHRQLLSSVLSGQADIREQIGEQSGQLQILVDGNGLDRNP